MGHLPPPPPQRLTLTESLPGARQNLFHFYVANQEFIPSILGGKKLPFESRLHSSLKQFTLQLVLTMKLAEESRDRHREASPKGTKGRRHMGEARIQPPLDSVSPKPKPRQHIKNRLALRGRLSWESHINYEANFLTYNGKHTACKTSPLCP